MCDIAGDIADIQKDIVDNYATKAEVEDVKDDLTASINSKIQAANSMTYKSSVSGFAELPIADVKVGDTVKASDTVVMLEAMKMENAIHAGRDGKVTSVNVNNGDSVLEVSVLITLE